MDKCLIGLLHLVRQYPKSAMVGMGDTHGSALRSGVLGRPVEFAATSRYNGDHGAIPIRI